MVRSPLAKRVTRHRRTASHCALHLIRALSPICEADIRAAHNRCRRELRRRASTALLRDLKEFFGIPIQRRRRRQLPPAPLRLPIIVSSADFSDEEVPVPAAPRVEVVDCWTWTCMSCRTWTLHHGGPPSRQAYVVLERMDAELPLPQLPLLPVTPPPDPPLEVDWAPLE